MLVGLSTIIIAGLITIGAFIWRQLRDEKDMIETIRIHTAVFDAVYDKKKRKDG